MLQLIITCYKIHILPLLNYMFYLFLTFMPIFVSIKYYLPFKNSSFMHYFKLQKLEFKQLINEMTINL